MSRKVCLVLVLAAGCHSSKMTPSSAAPPSPDPRVAVHRNVSLQCAHEAVVAVDPLVDHFAGMGGEMWDHLHGKKQFEPPPNLDRAAFVSFVTTPEGKDWLRQSGLFDGWYYGMVQICEARSGS